MKLERIACLLLVMFLIIGCQQAPGPEFRESFFSLAQEQGSVQCELSAMRDSISAKWDQMGQTLMEDLPEEMPETEKTNMIAVRNADLIRMFQSYEQLDYQIKMQLEEVEKEDSMMVIQIRALSQKLKELERSRMDKMNILQQAFPDETERWAMRYDSILQQNCKKTTY